MDMISFDDLKPGKFYINKRSNSHLIFQIIKPPCKTEDLIHIHFISCYTKINGFGKAFYKDFAGITEDSVKFIRKARINEIFCWYTFKIESKIFS